MPPFFFFFNDTATTEIYTLSLHDALPISRMGGVKRPNRVVAPISVNRSSAMGIVCACGPSAIRTRSEEHTSELQSRLHLVCRLLLEKKKRINGQIYIFDSVTGYRSLCTQL